MFSAGPVATITAVTPATTPAVKVKVDTYPELVPVLRTVGTTPFF